MPPRPVSQRPLQDDLVVFRAAVAANAGSEDLDQSPAFPRVLMNHVLVGFSGFLSGPQNPLAQPDEPVFVFRERPANPILPARALGIMFADDAWRIERKTRMTEGSGELGYSARLAALAGRRGREILGRNNSFH